MTGSLPRIKKVEDWLSADSNPIIIAGPCSAETEEQLHTTVDRIVAAQKVQLLRAGIWKPRTRPYTFEGVGEEGLKWLKDAGERVGLPVTTEVANAQHVEACLKAGIDVLWIGARTTVNPFSVQEIADALQGVDIPVIVKNPINPDLQLWLGAIERVRDAGIEKVAAMHRGFSFYGESVYRNEPRWEIPIALKTLLPEIPIFCDPSHIAGRRDLLQMVSQRAMDLGMVGLMLETHMDPDKAWSDAKQQVTPERLSEIISALEIREENSPDKSFIDRLSELRCKIDDIDEEIIALIARRMGVAKEIGKYKKENGVTVLQLERWKEIVKTRNFWGESLGLSEEFLDKYLEQIHKESIRTQTEIMNEGKDDAGIPW